MFDTGIAVEIPHGFFLEMRPRSGLATEGVIIVNSPTVIDEDFRSSVKVIMAIVSGKRKTIYVGDRICQCRLVPILPIEWVEVDGLSETKRGTNGLGSSGR